MLVSFQGYHPVLLNAVWEFGGGLTCVVFVVISSKLLIIHLQFRTPILTSLMKQKTLASLCLSFIQYSIKTGGGSGLGTI